MVEAGPQGAERVVEYEYRYTISDEYIEERMDLEGVEVSSRWVISFSLKDLPNPSVRQMARNLYARYKEIGVRPELRGPTDDPVEFLEHLREWVEGEDERAAYEEAQKQQMDADRELEAQHFEEEMRAWVEDHGTFRLKTALAKSYKITSSYAKDRGRKDLPGAWVDTAAIAEYRERVDPSRRALELESSFDAWLALHNLNLQTRIVWLVAPPSGMAELYEDAELDEIFGEKVWEFKQQEVLLVSHFLGRYDAYIPVDEDVRAPVQIEEDD